MRLNALTLPSIALLALLGCNMAPKDGGKVLANVAGEKITESDIREMLERSGVPKEKVAEFLTSPRYQDQRARSLDQVTMGKALVAYGKTTGLDAEPKVRQALDQAMANVYFQVLQERFSKINPSDAELKALYDRVRAEREAVGQLEGFPAFEQVKEQLPQLWRQEQVKAEVLEKISLTIADDWKAVGQR